MIRKVKIQNNWSEQYETSVGLRQEDALSCILFNLALEEVIKDLEIKSKGTIYIIKVPRYLLMLNV